MGIMGTEKGSFFKSPCWVDEKLAPGMTYQAPDGYPVTFSAWITGLLKLNFFWNSPNATWFLITVILWFAFPIDLEAAKVWNFDWVAARVTLYVVVTWIYYGFWYITLYWLHWSHRKFNPRANPPWTTVFHNFWYTTLGAIQCCGFEVIFLHLYATGKLPYIKDEDAFSSPANIAMTIGYSILVPVWRDFHFYFTHRFIHIRALYVFVHSLHHRNVDIEPFSGMAMHPIEHLYYFACVMPSIYMLGSPFHLFWNCMHLVLSPAASHSGWEDHFQSDQWHYLHHAKFECNYGVGGMPFDYLFGTSRFSFDPKKQKCYTGNASDKEIEKLGPAANIGAETIADKYQPKQKGFGKDEQFSISRMFPRFRDGIYWIFTIFIFGVLYCAILDKAGVRQWSIGPISYGYLVAALVAYGPIVFGILFLTILGDRYSWRWPFHKGSLFGLFSFHFIVGTMVSAMPVYSIITTLLVTQNKASSG